MVSAQVVAFLFAIASGAGSSAGTHNNHTNDTNINGSTGSNASNRSDYTSYVSDCEHPVWLSGYGCEDAPGYTDPDGWPCGSFDRNCDILWQADDQMAAEVEANCPNACGTCRCEDTPGYTDAYNNSCADYNGKCIGSAALLGYAQAVEDEVVRNCPKACNVCSCWEGCFLPGRDDELLLATRHLRERGLARNTSLTFEKGGWFSNFVTATIFETVCVELLGIAVDYDYTWAFYEVGVAIVDGSVHIGVELWPGEYEDFGEEIELVELGYQAKRGVFFSGVRSEGCGISNSTLCTPCTFQDVSAGRCAEEWLAFDHHRLHSTPQAANFFPALGSLIGPINESWKIWNVSGAGGMFQWNNTRFVPAHCTELEENGSSQRCMEMLSQGDGSGPSLEFLIEKTRFPYHVIYAGDGALQEIVEQRSANGEGVVFSWFEPDPWLFSMQAQRVAFPFVWSGCNTAHMGANLDDDLTRNDIGEGFGVAAGCDAPQVPLRSSMHYSVRKLAPAFYHALSGARISEQHMETLMRSHELGGGPYKDIRQVACGWMRSNVDVVKNWLPLHCGMQDDLLIASDGSTQCCDGEAKQLASDGPIVCVPRCNSSSQTPSVTAGRCVPLCPTGSVLVLAGSDSKCDLCPPGSYYAAMPDPLKTGVAAVCQLCPPGSYSAASGSSRCVTCHPGTFSTANSSSCLQCPAGTDPGEPGQRSCPCARGFYAPGGRAGHGEVCQPCIGPRQTTLFSASASKRDCVCSAGSFSKISEPIADSVGDSRNVSDLTCHACGLGLDCAEGLGVPSQAAGYFVQAVNPSSQGWRLQGQPRAYSVYRCRSTAECPAGPIGHCAKGRTGLACAICKAGHYPAAQGSCVTCDSGDLIPFVLLGLTGLVCLTMLAVFANVDVTTQHVAVATGAAVGGQFVASLQAMALFRTLSVEWDEPIRSMLEVVSLVSLDYDVLKMACVVNENQVTWNFAIKLLVVPALAFLLAVTMVILKKAGRDLDFDQYCNVIGTLVLIMFVTLMLTVLLPFNCLPNPNGTESMASNPGLVCWQGEHGAMAALGVAGLLLYPLCMFSLVLWITWRYPLYVAAGRSIVLLRRYKWLLHRFRLERYYFGLLYLSRAVLLSLVPVVFPGLHAEQVLTLSMLLTVYICALNLLWPWRSEVANYADQFMNLGLTCLLLGAAFLMPSLGMHDDSRRHRTISGFAVCAAVLVLASFGAALFFLVIKLVHQGAAYDAFLCHHKAGAASLARYFKCVFARDRAEVFLDSDNLLDLDVLFDVVRAHTQNLVVLGTNAVFERMWCAGEITTALANGVPVLIVKCDDYKPPDEGFLQTLGSHWSVDEVHTLNVFGISLPRIREAYRQLGGHCSEVNYPCFGNPEQQELAYNSLAEQCGVANRLLMVGGLSSMSHHSSTASMSLGQDEFGMVTGHPQDAEAIATCQVVCCLIQQQTAKAVRLVLSAAAYQDHLQDSTAGPLIVALTTGLLREPHFMKLLLSACEVQAPLHPVLVDKGFDFPGSEVYARVQHEGLQLPGLGADRGPEIARAYKALLKVLALPLSPAASLSLLSHQIGDICERVTKTKGTEAAKRMKMKDVAPGANDEPVIAEGWSWEEDPICL